MIRFDARQLRQLQHSLTERETSILLGLQQFRLLRGQQIRELWFHHHTGKDQGRRRCQGQMQTLCDRQLVERLERRVGGARRGSESTVYQLSTGGKRYLDFIDGNLKRSRAKHSRQPGALFTDHTLAIAQVYVDLFRRQHTGPVQIQVVEWQSEPVCWRSRPALGTTVWLKPDAFCKVQVGERILHWFIEVDMGSETLPTIQRKARSYLQHYQSGAEGNVMPRVLWLTTTERRARQMQTALESLGSVSTQLFMTGLQDQAAALIAPATSPAAQVTPIEPISQILKGGTT